MRYRKKDGFESIIAEEPKHALEEIADDIGVQSANGAISVLLRTPEGEKSASFSPEDTLDKVVEASGFGGKVKLVHVGLPLGVFVKADDLAQTKLGEAVSGHAAWGSTEIRVCGGETCVLNYLQSLLGELRAESCGRCVFCREGIKQVLYALNASVSGKGSAEDVTLMTEVAEAMSEASYCELGRAAGALVLSAVNGFRGEFDDHIKRKRCDAAVCRTYVTYHILGSKCIGCGDCADECDEDAIEGKKGFIYMIDNDECVKCGACMDACEEGAIVMAGAVKPRTPERLTRVGAWKGK